MTPNPPVREDVREMVGFLRSLETDEITADDMRTAADLLSAQAEEIERKERIQDAARRLIELEDQVASIQEAYADNISDIMGDLRAALSFGEAK